VRRRPIEGRGGPLSPRRVRLFGAVLADLFDELDWERLGASYCEGEAAGFFDAERRARVLDVGLALASDVASALGRRTGTSVYLGAAVAELAPILTEHLVLARAVVWSNLAGDESDELARALRAVGARHAVRLPEPAPPALDALAERSCDHLWIVSVLSDPDAFPALHDALYERAGTPLATGRGDLARDRARADALGDALLARARPPCLLSTTEEELVVLRPLAERRGLALRAPRAGRLSALVGDRVLLCKLGARA